MHSKIELTHCVNFTKNFLLPIELVIQLVVAVCGGQECISKGYEKVENVNNLKRFQFKIILDKKFLQNEPESPS